MNAHHAMVYARCSQHGYHACHFISRDDTAWLAARAVATQLRKVGFEVRCDVWREGERNAHTRPRPGDDLEWDDMPF